ncbi:C6 zinc finger domain protein [Penicillium nucicola]|uniref:C6 zinc finger domain protein n=1 Tax=Penicillium nucicola TaxID=1850975 RepID=UPI002545780D|nr:C6 zinc finger domain protein [Penicillium nucicola]KAJ5748275.1 C6 zinc finger domain protein [Penicillium nucicola]
MGARSRLGCLSCRRRKKKCDETKPTCTACQRNCINCVWPGPFSEKEEMESKQSLGKTVLSAQYVAMANTGSITSGEIPVSLFPLVLPGSVSSTGETWRILHHYLNDTANRLVCLQDNENPFLHTIFPAALDDELLMHSILALAGEHLMRRLPQNSSTIQLSTLRNYIRALKSLRVDLSHLLKNDGHRSVDSALRSLLVATKGTDPEAMKSHMEGANYLMAYILRSNAKSIQSTMGLFVTELFAYNACLASFTVECPTLATLWPNTSTGSLTPQSNKVGMLCGCAQDLFTFVPRVSKLLSDSGFKAQVPQDNQFQIKNMDLVDEYWRTRYHISRWNPTSTEHDIALGAELYQYSLLLLLDTRFQTLNYRDSVQTSFEYLKSLFLRLPPNSPIATTATWPLFVFGLNSHDPSDRDLVRQYMSSLIENFGMGIMETTLERLENSWETEAHEGMLPNFFAGQNELFLIC